MLDEFDRDDDMAYWMETIEVLLARGSSAYQAIKGADFAVQEHRRRRARMEADAPAAQDGLPGGPPAAS